MSVNLYVIESLPSPLLSIEQLTIDARIYLQTLNIDSVRVFKEVSTSGEIKNAVDGFFSWCTTVAENDWIVLLLSMHAKRPESPEDVATRAVSSHDLEDGVEWYKVFKSAKWRQRTIVIADICWGATPTLVRCTPTAGTPEFVFGPTRPACRLELNAAISLLIGQFGKDKDLRLESAMRIVDILNGTFPPNSNNDKAFYRVWWWDDGSCKPKRHPACLDKAKIKRLE